MMTFRYVTPVFSVVIGFYMFFTAKGGYTTGTGVNLTEGEAMIASAIFVMSGIILAGLNAILLRIEDLERMILSMIPPTEKENDETSSGSIRSSS